MSHALERVEVAADQPLVHALVEAYRAHSPTIELFDETRAVLDALQRTHRLALITDGLWTVQQRKVQALGLESYFEQIIYTGAWGAEFSKPHPRAYQCVQVKMQVPGKSCAYIGDNPHKDFVTAKRLGWHTIKVHRPGAEHEKILKDPHYQEDIRINSLSELLGVFN